MKDKKNTVFPFFKFAKLDSPTTSTLKAKIQKYGSSSFHADFNF